VDQRRDAVQHRGAVLRGGTAPLAGQRRMARAHRLVDQRRIGLVHLRGHLAGRRVDVVEGVAGGHEAATDVIPVLPGCHPAVPCRPGGRCRYLIGRGGERHSPGSPRLRNQLCARVAASAPCPIATLIWSSPSTMSPAQYRPGTSVLKGDRAAVLPSSPSSSPSIAASSVRWRTPSAGYTTSNRSGASFPSSCTR